MNKHIDTKNNTCSVSLSTGPVLLRSDIILSVLDIPQTQTKTTHYSFTIPKSKQPLFTTIIKLNPPSEIPIIPLPPQLKNPHFPTNPSSWSTFNWGAKFPLYPHHIKQCLFLWSGWAQAGWKNYGLLKSWDFERLGYDLWREERWVNEWGKGFCLWGVRRVRRKG